MCKSFYTQIQPALFETRLLDEHVPSPRVNSGLNLLEVWYVRRTYGAEKLWYSYLSYRVQNERDPDDKQRNKLLTTTAGKGRFVELRQVTEQICRKTKSDMPSPSTLSAGWH
ncbi:hypothetical protein ONS95_005148 [Cadophora gregata]|uniref:uncharacterized protein n=1 Tax=Cadophora gregata TaxID=51156 RepID=UPI0026DB492B|nr:uncharacterized protein ONS95_005148 [Cadophora gregata]KAK0104882.1 hypothetical protein ONS95_005148 [Cadophora gregata]